jgi:hypothetical protein
MELMAKVAIRPMDLRPILRTPRQTQRLSDLISVDKLIHVLGAVQTSQASLYGTSEYANASMIFLAKRTMSEGVSNATPTTSNLIEHRFSLLHRATGTEQDLIPDIKKLHLHVEELHNQYLAIKGT